MKLYKIRPLKWIGDITEDYDSIIASTPFGNYTITKRSEEDGYCWGFCFDEYYDEDQTNCDTIQEGKKAAQAHWLNRISGALQYQPRKN